MDRVQQAHRRKVYGQRLRRLHRKVSRRQERTDNARVRIFVPVFVIEKTGKQKQRRRSEKPIFELPRIRIDQFVIDNLKDLPKE